MLYFKVLSWYLPAGTRKPQETLIRIAHVPSRFWIQGHNIKWQDDYEWWVILRFITQHYPRGSEENCEKPHSGWPTFESGTSTVQIRRAFCYTLFLFTVIMHMLIHICCVQNFLNSWSITTYNNQWAKECRYLMMWLRQLIESGEWTYIFHVLKIHKSGRIALWWHLVIF